MLCTLSIIIAPQYVEKILWHAAVWHRQMTFFSSIFPGEWAFDARSTFSIDLPHNWRIQHLLATLLCTDSDWQESNAHWKCVSLSELHEGYMAIIKTSPFPLPLLSPQYQAYFLSLATPRFSSRLSLTAQSFWYVGGLCGRVAVKLYRWNCVQ